MPHPLIRNLYMIQEPPDPFSIPPPLDIRPVDVPGDRHTGTLRHISPAEIERILGFPPNVTHDDAERCEFSWGFTVDGVRCGVWSYRGSERHGWFSTWGPRDTLRAVFGRDRAGD
jgi:hypothetical protein